MNNQAALFDVDGTIINGNCTKIFIQYLDDKNFIKQSDLIPFNKKCSLYLTSDSHYSEVIKEAIRVLSKLDIKEFRRHWRQCFQEDVKNKFNIEIVNRMRKFQENGLEIILASGSPLELVFLIGSELNIKKGNIIATESKIINHNLSPEKPDSICFGEGKKKKVIDFFKTKGIDLKSSYFFTDNLSDLDLLAMVGKKYWVGSEELYLEYSMEKKGIEKLKTQTKISRKPVDKKAKMDQLLYNYYLEKKTLIEESVYEIIPPKCTSDSMNYLVGKINLTWDFNTLQKIFFDPIHEYIDKRQEKIFCLGSSLFLEAAGLNIVKYKSLIGIGELLDLSNEMFFDIKEWTSMEKLFPVNKSHLDVSIIGNVAIALITLASHNLLSNKVEFSEEKQFHLLESFVSIGFNSLFGNGLKLYWEQHGDIKISLQEYYKIAYLINMRQLQIPGALWLILQQEEPAKSSVEAFGLFIENISIATQLQKDLLSFDQWLKHLDQPITNKFNIFINYLSIYTAVYFNNPSIFFENPSSEKINKLLKKADSIKYTQQKLNEFKNKAFNALEQLPIKQKYKKLIKSYTIYLMNR
jgi:HAD superfamily hydrolase (TIGR01490 family)